MSLILGTVHSADQGSHIADDAVDLDTQTETNRLNQILEAIFSVSESPPPARVQASTRSIETSSVATDREALVALYNATGGPDWEYSVNWLTDAPLGDWYGVTTDARGRVISLYLGGTFSTEGLVGNLPDSIGDLTELEFLDLSGNRLSGPIPSAIGKLSLLTHLSLADNEFEGPIPSEIGNLSNLTTLRLGDNELEGSLPSVLFGLSELVELELGNNQFRGRLSSEIGNLQELHTLGLSYNGFFGELPETLVTLVKLKELTLNSNNFSGTIPRQIGNLADVLTLNLGYNNFSGEIPTSIGELTSVTRLYLHDNVLSGSIPREIGTATSLLFLDVAGNNLSGRITPQLTKLHSLEGLNLANNNFSGPVISGLRHISTLRFLYLHNNSFEGPLPARLADARNIDFFSISGNQVCIPGTLGYVNWLRGVVVHDIDPKRFCNADDRIVLASLYEQTKGSEWLNNEGWEQDYEILDRWHGIETDHLGRVKVLDLSANGLSGTLPLNLGALSGLQTLRLQGNQLEGRLPLSFMHLRLNDLNIANTQLCEPPDSLFQLWLNELATSTTSNVMCEPLSDQDVLEILYQQVGGEAWGDSTAWQSDLPIDQWHGVETDEGGRVVQLDMSGNNLRGTLPIEIRKLEHLRYLNLSQNELAGSVPSDLGLLTNLRQLMLHGNQLSGEIPPELGQLSELAVLRLEFNEFGGQIPSTIGKLVNLETLSFANNALSGRIPQEIWQLANLRILDLRRNQLSGSISSQIQSLSNLEYLNLANNAFLGALPAELGQLKDLRILNLYDNQFVGPIPTELFDLLTLSVLNLQGNRLTGTIPLTIGNLSEVNYLDLSDNALTGPIPSTIGRLLNLNSLNLADNDLSGDMPSTLGGLPELESLFIQRNNLTGLIPNQLGNLGSLRILNVSDNTLSGPIPTELGQLSLLRELRLNENNLSGVLPDEIGDLVGLTDLDLSNNPNLAGPLPSEISNLSRLNSLLTTGTNLCIPSDDVAFHNWPVTLFKRRIRSCDVNELPTAYLTQAVQSHTYPVPLISNKPALLRVFPNVLQAASSAASEVRAHFFQNDEEVFVESVDLPPNIVESDNPESDLDSTLNIEVPGFVVKRGLSLAIEVVSQATANTNVETISRVPEQGSLPIEVHDLQPFELTLIPFVWDQATDDKSIVDTVKAIARSPHEHELLEESRRLLPIDELVVHTHEAVITSSNDPIELLFQTSLINALENGRGYYMGMMTSPRGFILGIANISGKNSFSIPRTDVIAHELGHNLSLFHAPCGGAGGPDRSYPYSDGSSGAWGYDFRNGGEIVSPTVPDFMSYCSPVWVSDYHFSNSLRWRLFDERRQEGVSAATRESLLVSGSRLADGSLILKPTFVVNASARLPEKEGDYVLQGLTSEGREIFTIDFAMYEVSETEDEESFLFVLPVEDHWQDQLDSISLSSEISSVSQEIGSSPEMTILRNPQSKQVRGILEHHAGMPASVLSEFERTARESGLEILSSSGLPSAESWELNP